MVVFPLGKLLYLGMKQVTKPIANQLKSTAKRSEFFRRYICIPPAQGLHRLEMFVKFRLMGAKGSVEFKPLSQEKAVDLGAEMLGEFFIYMTAASYIVYEYWKGIQKDKERDSTQDEQGTSLDLLEERMRAIENELKKMSEQLNETKREATRQTEKIDPKKK